jgi:hypothetical protein
MFNAIDKLINTVHGIGKEKTHLVIPTYVTRPVAPTRPVMNEEFVYVKIVVNGQVLEGQAAIDFLNK